MKFREKQDTIGIMRHFGKVFLWIIFPLFLGFSSNEVHANSVSLFGRYVGVLKHEALNKEQLAKLDFIVSRSSSNELELKAILSLHFGDFKSGEYVSYHYDKVRFNVLTGGLVFDNPEQPLSIFVKSFSQGKLVGEVTSIWAGQVGELLLSQTPEPVKPKAAMIEPIWGEYAGSCGDETATLQLYTMRTTDDLAHLAQPFGPYSIKGGLYAKCTDGYCLTMQFVSGAYNFFAHQEQLTLVGPRYTIQCTVDSNSLDCKSPMEPHVSGTDLSKCSFKRISKETEEPRQFIPVEHSGVFGSSLNDIPLSEKELKALQTGEYRGYVFHEHLGVYQAASVNINLFQSGMGIEGGTKISAFGRLFFGDFKSSEFISYRFGERVYPNPLLGSQNLVFDHIDANMDAVVQITDIKEGVIRGNWYSIIFGRVGPFELRKSALPTLPKNANKMDRLSGTYLAQTLTYPNSLQWSINLRVAPGLKPPTTTENPFFPNLILGTIQLPITPYLAISDGSYDFYTGRIGFKQEEIGGTLVKAEHNWIGTRIQGKGLYLKHVTTLMSGAPDNSMPLIFRVPKETQ